MSFEFEAIGTHWWITIEDDISATNKQKAFTELEQIAKQFEKDYSRFIPESFIGRLNQEKHLEDFPPELYDMLQYSANISHITDGHFSAAVGGTLASLGYDENYSFTKSGKVLPGYILRLDKDKIELSNDARVDLGGIGKGWLIDKLARHLKEKNIHFFCVNGGGDIFATTHKDGTAWEFFLENPRDKEEVIGTIQVKHAAIACSSPSRRQWKDKNTGESLHHLIDQKSKLPVTSIKMVFTYGKDALSADTASTALFVSPPVFWDRIQEVCEVNYLIFTEAGTIYQTEG